MFLVQIVLLFITTFGVAAISQEVHELADASACLIHPVVDVLELEIVLLLHRFQVGQVCLMNVDNEVIHQNHLVDEVAAESLLDLAGDISIFLMKIRHSSLKLGNLGIQ